MPRTIVLLDTGVLGQVTHPRAAQSGQAKEWLTSLLEAGIEVRVPEIADYELRRELIRAGKNESVDRLDEFASALGYVPITTPAMRKAAEFWARARNQGTPTAEDAALDADMILSAQASITAALERAALLIATTNVEHLSLFADARLWTDITAATA